MGACRHTCSQGDWTGLQVVVTHGCHAWHGLVGVMSHLLGVCATAPCEHIYEPCKRMSLGHLQPLGQLDAQRTAQYTSCMDVSNSGRGRRRRQRRSGRRGGRRRRSTSCRTTASSRAGPRASTTPTTRHALGFQEETQCGRSFNAWTSLLLQLYKSRAAAMTAVECWLLFLL